MVVSEAKLVKFRDPERYTLAGFIPVRSFHSGSLPICYANVNELDNARAKILSASSSNRGTRCSAINLHYESRRETNIQTLYLPIVDKAQDIRHGH